MKRYGITITEIYDEDPPGGYWGPFRTKHHEEKDIFTCTLPEKQFEFALILAAVLRSVKEGEPK